MRFPSTPARQFQSAGPLVIASITVLLFSGCRAPERQSAVATPFTNATQIGAPIAGTSTLRLIGVVSRDGLPLVVLADNSRPRPEICWLAVGERMGIRENGISCDRFDYQSGTWVVTQGQRSFTVRTPLVPPARPGQASLWLTNCPSEVGFTVVSELTQRTLLRQWQITNLVFPTLAVHLTTTKKAAHEIVKAYEKAGIALVPHGAKWMLALRSQDTQRYERALPKPPPLRPAPVPMVATTDSKSRIRAGTIKLQKTPLEQVLQVYAELAVEGRKITLLGPLPKRRPYFEVSTVTDLSREEAKHTFEVAFLLNDLKIELINDREFRVVEW